MVREISWQEFRESGALWFINSILHVIGLAIVLEESENTDSPEIQRVYPARVRFRGFSEEKNSQGYVRLSQFMSENHLDILEESKE